MKKNENGFTLIELIAVITIMAIIVVLAIPNITREIKDSDERQQNVLDMKIENAAKLYVAKKKPCVLTREPIASTNNYHPACEVPSNFTFTLRNLINEGLLELNKSQCMEVRDQAITVSNSNETIIYDYDKISNGFRVGDKIENNCHTASATGE